VARSGHRGEGPDKPVEPRARVADSAATPAAPLEDVDAAFREWDELAEGTPPRATTPVVSRTSTRHDPFTTELLAEVSRQADTEPEAPPEPPTTRIQKTSPHVVRKPR
jgi:hypothetical protein